MREVQGQLAVAQAQEEKRREEDAWRNTHATKIQAIARGRWYQKLFQHHNSELLRLASRSALPNMPSAPAADLTAWAYTPQFDSVEAEALREQAQRLIARSKAEVHPNERLYSSFQHPPPKNQSQDKPTAVESELPELNSSLTVQKEAVVVVVMSGEEMEQQTAVTKIQAVWRRRRTWRHQRQLVWERRAQMAIDALTRISARTIQCAIRRHQVQSRLPFYRTQHEHLTRRRSMAVRIQSHFRMRIARAIHKHLRARANKRKDTQKPIIVSGEGHEDRPADRSQKASSKKGSTHKAFPTNLGAAATTDMTKKSPKSGRKHLERDQSASKIQAMWRSRAAQDLLRGLLTIGDKAQVPSEYEDEEAWKVHNRRKRRIEAKVEVPPTSNGVTVQTSPTASIPSKRPVKQAWTREKSRILEKVRESFDSSGSKKDDRLSRIYLSTEAQLARLQREYRSSSVPPPPIPPVSPIALKQRQIKHMQAAIPLAHASLWHDSPLQDSPYLESLTEEYRLRRSRQKWHLQKNKLPSLDPAPHLGLPLDALALSPAARGPIRFPKVQSRSLLPPLEISPDRQRRSSWSSIEVLPTSHPPHLSARSLGSVSIGYQTARDQHLLGGSQLPGDHVLINSHSAPGLAYGSKPSTAGSTGQRRHTLATSPSPAYSLVF